MKGGGGDNEKVCLLDHQLFTKLHCILFILQFIHHFRNFTIHVKKKKTIEKVLFTIMVNRNKIKTPSPCPLHKH